jgi:hypothetical protein
LQALVVNQSSMPLTFGSVSSKWLAPEVAHEANGAAITMFCPALNARLGSGTCLHQPTAPFGAIKPKPALPHANLHT